MTQISDVRLLLVLLTAWLSGAAFGCSIMADVLRDRAGRCAGESKR